MKILQIVARPLPARFIAQDFVVCAVLASPMNFGEILEEKPRALNQRKKRSVMIGGKRVQFDFSRSNVLRPIDEPGQ